VAQTTGSRDCTSAWGLLATSSAADDEATAVAEKLLAAGAKLFDVRNAAGLVGIARKGWLPRQRIRLDLLANLVYRFASETIRPEPRSACGSRATSERAVVLSPVVLLLWWHDRQPASPTGRTSERVYDRAAS
jgi:hypothetical protein